MLNSIKVFVCDSKFSHDAVNSLRHSGLVPRLCPKDGSKLLDLILSELPDAVIMPVYMPALDALSVMDKVRSVSNKPPVFIVTTSYDSDIIYNQLMDCGASYVLVEPFDCSVLGERIKKLVYGVVSSPGLYALEEEISAVLHSVGIPAHIKGYKYLRCAIMLTVNDEMIIESVTKALYPEVASTFSTTPMRVERAIRHAIELAWTRGEPDKAYKLFGNTVESSRGKPTNSEFIAMIADRIRLKQKRLRRDYEFFREKGY